MPNNRELNNRSWSTPGTRRRSAFTLVEVLVALAILMLMLTIILVPINMGLNIFHIGKARSEVQQANQLVVNQLAKELRQAIHVFPNENMPGITDKASSPYFNNSNQPYYNIGTASAVSNTTRLDFLLPAVASNGSILTPPQANNYIVSYYARRLKSKMDDGTTDNPYDAFTNPIVLWRAQYPYREDDGDDFTAYSTTNSNASKGRYPIGASPYNGRIWLTQSAYGEPDLSTVSADSVDTNSSSHTLITPRDMALVSPSSTTNSKVTKAELTATDPTNAEASLQPDSSFVCDDGNNDGKIDRVTISLFMAKYDSIGAADDKSQQIRSTQTVDLPNIK